MESHAEAVRASEVTLGVVHDFGYFFRLKKRLGLNAHAVVADTANNEINYGKGIGSLFFGS